MSGFALPVPFCMTHISYYNPTIICRELDYKYDIASLCYINEHEQILSRVLKFTVITAETYLISSECPPRVLFHSDFISSFMLHPIISISLRRSTPTNINAPLKLLRKGSSPVLLSVLYFNSLLLTRCAK